LESFFYFFYFFFVFFTQTILQGGPGQESHLQICILPVTKILSSLTDVTTCTHYTTLHCTTLHYTTLHTSASNIYNQSPAYLQRKHIATAYLQRKHTSACHCISTKKTHICLPNLQELYKTQLTKIRPG